MIGGSIVDVYLLLLSGFGLLQIGRSKIALRVVGVFICILGSSLLLLAVYGHGMDIFLRQGIPALFIYTGLSVLIEKTTADALVGAYRSISFYTALFGILQFILSIGGVAILMKTPMRLDSLAYEASHYAIAMGPAVYLSLKEMVQKRSLIGFRAWVTIVALVLTISMTSVIVLSCCGMLLAAQKRGLIIGLFLFGILFYLNFHRELLPWEIHRRIIAIERAGEIGSDLGQIYNLSVLSPLSNWEVAEDSVKMGRIFGNGLGGHFYAYMDHFRETAYSLRARFGTNAIGGHSLLIRAISEFGVVGLAVYFRWVFLGLSRVRDEHRIWWTLSAIYLIGRAIKLGGFFELGLPIFILAPFIFDRLPRRPRLRPLPSRVH